MRSGLVVIPRHRLGRQGASPVTDEGVAFYDNQVIPYLRKRADVIHAEGAACYAQMYHLGASHTRNARIRRSRRRRLPTRTTRSCPTR